MTRHRYARAIPPVAVALGLLAGAVGQAAAQQPSQGQKLGHAAQHKNMKLVGHNDLQARSAYQPIVHQHPDGRWIAYVGHHGGSALNPLTGVRENNGTSIVDVTNPGNPVYLKHIPGPSGVGEAGGAQMVRACNGSDLPRGIPGRTYMLRAHGTQAHQVWDVTDPSNPTLVSTPVSGLGATHKSWWECETGIAYLVSGVPGWRVSRVTQVFDLSDPANPVHIRDFGLVGQQPGATGPFDPQGPHGCISVVGQNRIYCGHGTGSDGILSILDRSKLLDRSSFVDPRNPTPAELAFPLVSRLNTPPFMGAHTTFPVLQVTVPEFAKDIGPTARRIRDFIVMVNERIGNMCTGLGRQMIFMIDITEETKPFGVANFQVPEASGDFCSRGGPFGAHASNESFTDVFYKKLVFVSWSNAGVRAIDIREPFSPREAGFYIPATNENTIETCATIGGESVCKRAIQTNNVEVDDRGFIYLADRFNTGLHIVELTGSAREIANLP